MRGGGPDGAPVVSLGMAARGRNHDRAGGRDGAVLGRRVQPREDLDRQDVDGGDLLEHLQVLDGYVIEDHTHLVALIEARPPAPLIRAGSPRTSRSCMLGTVNRTASHAVLAPDLAIASAVMSLAPLGAFVSSIPARAPPQPATLVMPSHTRRP